MKGIKENYVINYIVLIIIYILIFDISIYFTTTAFAQEDNDPSNNTQKLTADEYNIYKLNTAIDLYKAGNDEQAKELFLVSKRNYPNNSISAYYLALIYAKQDNLSDAVSEWRRYLKLNPKSETSNQIRQFITILAKEDSKRKASKIVKEQGHLNSAKIEDNTVAVTYFYNTGSSEINPLSKGLAAMLIADLSQVNGLKVVELEKIQAIYNEMKISSNSIVEKSAVSKLQELLQTRNIVTGSYSFPITTDLQITSAVTEQDTEKGLKDVNGKLTEFYDLEKETAQSILSLLKYNWKDVPEETKKIHTTNYESFVAYSAGLDYMDKEDYKKAKLSLKKAVDIDPNFELAKEAYLATPEAVLTVAAVIVAATSAAPPTSVVGTTLKKSETGLIVGAVASGASMVGTVIAGVVTTGSYSGSGITGNYMSPYNNWSGDWNMSFIDGENIKCPICSIHGTWNMSISFDNTCAFKVLNCTENNVKCACCTNYSTITSTTGTLNGATVTINTPHYATLIGTISGNSINGTISASTSTGTWTGTKQK